ncbi:MAG: hypothetical protein E7357_02910 [Clostridiales bacterium]|nr:hypothetical protein [Clostridiales bacterium]
MRKKWIKFLAAACCLTCVAAAGVGIANLGNDSYDAKAYEITFDGESPLQGEYAYGTSVSIPMGFIDGQKTTKCMVISPSGKVYETADIVLSETGRYTIVWYATVGGKEVSAEKTFSVTKSVFTVSGGVEYEYKEVLDKTPGLDKDEDGVMDAGTQLGGYKVSLQPDSSFRYNQAVDLSDSSVPFAHIFPYHGITNIAEAATKDEYKYNEEARNYLITLTDCYDSTNSVTIDLEWQEGRTYWNFKAGAVGQTAHGLRDAGATSPVDELVEIDGAKYRIMYAPGQGRTSCNVMDNYGLKLYYDTEKNQLFITFCRYASEKYTVNERKLIADLDNERINPDSPFKGFTTGEVYITFSAKNYVSNVANLDIASIGGLSGSEIGNIDMHDTKAPVIEVADALQGDSAFIALNEEIQIPNAFAHDLSLAYDTKASVAVYYAYDPNNSKNVLVGLTDGKFTPTKPGMYTIVYSATDTSGNVGTAAVNLQCALGVDNQALKLTVDGKVQANAGDYLPIPECTLEGLYTDKTAIKTYVQFEDGENVLLDTDTIFLQGVGNYVLTYAYETAFKTYTAQCTVTAKASDKVTLASPILPEYFINGATYTLDAVTAYEYTAKEPVQAESKVYISEDGDEYVLVDRKAVVINATQTVSFKYEHKGVATYSDTIKVVDVGFKGELAMEKYFYNEEGVVTASATAQGVQYVSDGTAKNAMLKYVNVLSLSTFSVDFSVLGGKGAYVAPAAITVTIVDYYDRDNKIALRFANGGATVNFSIDGAQKATTEQAFLDTKITASYDKGSFKFGGTLYPWKGAFTSDKVLLWVTLEGMDGTACLQINKLCDNKFSDATKDKADPTLYVSKLHTGYQPFNTVITIVPASASDVFAPYVESGLRLTAKKPDGTFATSVDGVLLDGTCSVTRAYELELDTLGIYMILYEYTDQNGNYCSLGYSPTLKDETNPTLIVEGVYENQVLTAAWGETVTVKDYTVSDDISSEASIVSWISVFYPSGTVREPEANGTFYADEKGNYTVYYCAYDETGNYTTFAYVVSVS